MPRPLKPLTPLTPEQSALADANRGIAWMVALRYHRRAMGEDARDELLAVSLLALCRAAQGFDSERGFAFSTYAARCCRRAILDERRNGGLIHTPKYLRLQAGTHHRHRAARDRIREAEMGSDGLHDCSDLTLSADPVHQAELHEMRDRIRELPYRERFAVERSLEGWTNPEIAAVMSYSREGVRRILGRARDRLCAQIGR